MGFIHVDNHPHAKALFVACCKMSNKHPIAGYHHDKQIKQPQEFGFSPFCLCTMRTMMMTPIWNFWISTTWIWIRIKKREAKWDAFIWNQSCESCSTTRSSWNKTILASQTHFQNVDNQSWKPLGTTNSKFPVAVAVGKGVIRCQFAESLNLLEGFVM